MSQTFIIKLENRHFLIKVYFHTLQTHSIGEILPTLDSNIQRFLVFGEK